MNAKRKKLYEGKAKILYEGPEPGTLIQYFKDDATAFNGEKKAQLEGKGVLKDAARLVVPHEVIDRKKGYFPVPQLKYIQGEYLDMVRDALGSAKARERGLFKQDYLDTLFDDPASHITPLRGSELWQVALLEMWLQTQGV